MTTMSSITTTTTSQSQQKGIFSIPPLIKTLFDTFPLITYPAYPVPARCLKPSTRPRLYAWISPDEARRGGGGYSFDAECLKWQVGGPSTSLLPYYPTTYLSITLRDCCFCGKENREAEGGVGAAWAMNV